MNPELVSHVEKLSLSCSNARPGDIGTLAELLDNAESLRQAGEIHQVSGIIPVAEAIGDLIKRLIMGEADDDDADMRVLRDSVAVLQTALNQGELPQSSAFPVGLRLPAGNGGGDGSVAAGAAHLAAPEAPAPADAAPPVEMDVDLSGSVAVGGDEAAFAADEELLGEYLTEQRSRLEEIEGQLLTLERGRDDAALADLRRALHTIKGDSGFLGLSEVAKISHAAESYLEAATYPYELEYLFRVKDWLSRAFSDLAAGGRLSGETSSSLAHLLRKLDAPADPPAKTSAAPAAAPPVEPQKAPAAPAASVAAPAEPPKRQAEPGTAAAKEAYFQLTADESLLVDFISESKEHLDQASSQLLSLESEPENEEAINSVFRAFHTVKGIAGFLNLAEISQLAHSTENLLDQVRRRSVELSPPVIDIVFEALDWMTRLIGNVRTALQGDGRATTEAELDPFIARVKDAQQGRIQVPPPKPAPAAEPDAAARSAPRPNPRLGEILVESGAVERVAVEDALDEAQKTEPDSKVGEVLVKKELVTPRQVHAALREQAREKESAGPRKAVELKETLRVDYDRLENMINTIGELVLAEAMISQDDNILGIHSEGLDKKLHNLRQVSRKLQELGTTIRMVPISGTFQKMARLVRDLSRKSGKPINFQSHGDETELDRAYVDLIADPLVHMIRNAVDHGIESPQVRNQRGKPELGTIDLRAFHEGGNIHVEIRDDGQGLDVDRIFAKAVEKELVTADQREHMSEQEIFQMIFLPGFSTAAQVTEVSGRGVGMDVVRRNIAELRGQVQITSERGAGSTFKIILPLTLALIDGMLVRVGEERFIFPVLSVVESARPSADMINTVVGKGEMINLRGRQLPLYRLSRLFGVPGAKEDVTQALVVVVENDGRQVGIVVDDLIGIQQTVIKSLGSGLLDTKGLSGGSIMADGTVGLIVDISGLISIARNGGTMAEKMLSEQVN